MLEIEISWNETSYKIDLKFGVSCLIAQYLLLIPLLLEVYAFYSISVLGVTCGVGISSIFILLSCRRNYKKFRQDKLIAESWWKLKEYGGWK